MIVCRTLGTVELSVDGADAPPELLWRKNLALLVYLARSPKRTRTREHLTGLLWGEKPESAARHSLREAIRVLRRALGEEHINAEHDRVRLGEDSVRLDTEEFEQLERAGEWQAAAELVTGDFLEGFSVPDASAFEDWLGAERLEWRRRGVGALVDWADTLLGSGNIEGAAATAARALDIDAGSNGATQVAMKALALAGDRGGALTRFEQLSARLAEMGAAPDAETAALADRVKAERVWRLSDGVPVEPHGGAELRRPPLAGRSTDLKRLMDAFEAALEQRHAAVGVIEAATGMGKSRLAEEVLSRARLAGAATASVRAVEGDLSQPGSGALGLARGGLLDARGLAGAAPAALAAFAADIPEWADRFGPLQETPAPFAKALCDVLRAVAEEQPLAVLVDDAHWLDRDSLLALFAAVRDLAHLPVFVLLAAQTQPPRSEIDDLRSRIGRDVPGAGVVLQPLDQAALRELAAWAVPEFDAAELDRLARRVAADSAGLPLLAVELYHAVALGLDLGRIEGAWPEPARTLDQSLPTDLPDAVVGAIRVGFRRLTPNAQRVLATAAVLGDRVSASRLERVTGQGKSELLAALDELEWQRWMVAEPRGYAFLARIVREVVARDMLTEGQRQRILEVD
jgi:DNA-binding SARP family transcriptional activator